MKIPKKYFTTGDIAKYCEVDINTVKRWIKQGNLSAFKIPTGHYRIPRHAFVDFIKQHGFLYEPDYFGERIKNVDILVIDDDPNHRELIIYDFEKRFNGLIVETASNGFDGYLKLNQYKPKLVLLDLVMPGITGIELLKIVRSNKQLVNEKIIVISAYLDKPTMMELNNLNVDDIFKKPLDMNDLFSKYRNVFNSNGKSMTVQSVRENVL